MDIQHIHTHRMLCFDKNTDMYRLLYPAFFSLLGRNISVVKVMNNVNVSEEFPSSRIKLTLSFLLLRKK